jgi:hypothetical protein
VTFKPPPRRPATSGSFKRGQSGNPGGRPKALMEVIELARSHTREAISALADIVRNGDAPPSAQVAAATALLDRGWGKPVQPSELSGPGGTPLQTYVVRMPTPVESVRQWMDTYAPEAARDKGD